MPGHFLDDLCRSFALHAHRPALVHGEHTFSYRELDERARHAAAWLHGLGVAPGDRVALCTPNKLPFLIAHLGVLFAGAVPLPLNPRFTREELRYFLDDSGARLAIVGADQEPLLGDLTTTVADVLALTPPAAAWRAPSVATEEPCLLIYSSGTTGWPKGVVHCHAGVAGSLQALADCWRMSADDVIVNVLPLFHIHGLAFATHLPWLTGGCVLLEDSFDPQRSLATIGRGTVFMAVPTLYYRLLEEPTFATAARTWTRARLFTCGSAPIRPEVLPRLQEILGRPVVNRYGMTEAYVITSLPLDGPWPAGSVGLPLEGIDLCVRAEDGSSAPPGMVGSVHIRGPHLFRGYWNKPEASRAAFADGWFDTGDLGMVDAAGFLTLVGRKHDLIITSGYNVYPQLVERVLGACPGVRECAVLGLPDPDRGERVVAAVVRGDSSVDETTLHAWLADRLIHYQQPRAFVFLDTLPRNSMGKVLRRDLRAHFASEPEHG